MRPRHAEVDQELVIEVPRSACTASGMPWVPIAVWSSSVASSASSQAATVQPTT